MEKCLIFSDLHIHDHKKSIDRLEDCISVLNWIFKVAVEHKVSNIIFLGDLFHDRNKINVFVYQRAFEAIFKTPVDFYLLLGNHDLWHKDKWHVSSCKPFSAIPKVHVISSPTTLTIGSTKFDFLPFTENPIAALEALKESSAKILCAHLAVSGARLNVLHDIYSDVIVEHDGEMVIVDTNIFSSWKKVFLGHYHGEYRINNIEYVGSPLQLSFGEAFQKKHIMIFDGENIEYIENDFSPKHFIISDQDISNYDLEGHFVRLFVDDISNTDVIDLQKNIKDNYKPASLEIRQNKKQEQNHIVDNAKAILYKEEEMLEMYIKDIKDHGLSEEKLLTIGKKICEVGIE